MAKVNYFNETYIYTYIYKFFVKAVRAFRWAFVHNTTLANNLRTHIFS